MGSVLGVGSDSDVGSEIDRVYDVVDSGSKILKLSTRFWLKIGFVGLEVWEWANKPRTPSPKDPYLSIYK